MANKFRALLVTKEGNRQNVAITELTDADLMAGDAHNHRGIRRRRLYAQSSALPD